jgi:hypothetical protein
LFLFFGVFFVKVPGPRFLEVISVFVLVKFLPPFGKGFDCCEVSFEKTSGCLVLSEEGGVFLVVF